MRPACYYPLRASELIVVNTAGVTRSPRSRRVNSFFPRLRRPVRASDRVSHPRVSDVCMVALLHTRRAG